MMSMMTTKRLTTIIENIQQQPSVLTQLRYPNRRRRPISSSNASSSFISSFKSPPISNKYVWKEPPGRMRKILDTMRRNEAQLEVMKNKSLPQIKEVCKRIRISNSAMVTRVGLLEDVYNDCATLMQKVRETLESVCQQHDRSSPSRNLSFPQSHTVQNKNDIIDTAANADRCDARNVANSIDASNKKDSEDHLHSTTTTFHHDATTGRCGPTTNPTHPTTFHLERRRPEAPKDLHKHPLLTELLRFDTTTTTTATK